MRETFSSGCRWIWLLDRNFNESDRRVLFRKTFELSAVPEHVWCKISADSRYMFYVNGTFVHYGPVRSAYNGSWPYDRIDIAGFLHPGRNVIAVRVVHLAANIFCQPAAMTGGLLMDIPEIGIFSDESFRALSPEGFRRGTNKCSFQYTYQENVDLSGVPSGYQELDFDDSAWMSPDLLKVVDAEPFGSLIEREIPLLTCQTVQPVQGAVTRWQGCGVPEDEPVGLYCRENPDWKNPSADGNVSGTVFDFGFVRLGTVILEYSGAAGGEYVDLLFSEGAIDGIPFLLPPAECGGVATASRLKLAAGCGVHELDMPFGLRYVTAVIRNCSENVKINVALRDLSYPLEVSAKFSSSEKLLNEIHQMAERTQRSCSSDTYIDCPWREQVQWWGDARIQILNTFALSTDDRLLRRGIRMIGETETVSGLTRAFAPAMPWHTVIPDFSLIWVQTFYDAFFQSGTTELFSEHSSRIARVLNYFAGCRDERGVFLADPRYWNFYDWGFSAGNETFPVLGNMIYLNALEKCDVLEKLSGTTLDTDHHIQGQLREFLTGFFHTPQGQTALAEPRNAAYAVLNDLLPHDAVEYAGSVLLNAVSADIPQGASPYFIHYLFEALKKLGYHVEVIQCIRRRWGHWLEMGITTTPESWVEKERLSKTSLCHAWSAHVLAHFRDILLGVTQTAPNWQEISFAPVYAGVEEISGIIPTPRGNISVEIDHRSGKKNIQLPPGISIRK